jgi:uncharacterized membrane protein
MKLKVLAGVLVFLIVLNLATIGTFLYVHFTRAPGPPALLAPEEIQRGPARMGRPWFRRLPSEDRDELFSLLREFHAETRDLRTKLRSLENRIFEIMQNDPVAAAAVDSLLEEAAAVRLDISRVATRKLIEAKTILPPEEQRMFFDSILQARPGPRMTRGLGDGPYFRVRGPGIAPDSLER